GLVQLIAPFAPHTAEELWHQLGNKDSVHIDHWPEWDDNNLVADTITIAVQINGKVRAEVEIKPDATEEEAVQAAKANQKAAQLLDGQTVKKAIYVKGRLVNFVI